jgi:hypothetical protein
MNKRTSPSNGLNGRHGAAPLHYGPGSLTAVLALVLAEPALPLDNDAGLEISNDELQAIKQRLETENLSVMAYRAEIADLKATGAPPTLRIDTIEV